jgi:hypothetical protein
MAASHRTHQPHQQTLHMAGCRRAFLGITTGLHRADSGACPSRCNHNYNQTGAHEESVLVGHDGIETKGETHTAYRQQLEVAVRAFQLK